MNLLTIVRLRRLAMALLALAWVGLTASSASATDAAVEFTAKFAPAQIRAGETTTLELEAKIPPGYHLYSFTSIADGPLPLKVSVESENLRIEGEWHGPNPLVEMDPNFGKLVEYYEREVVHQRTFSLTKAEPGALKVPLVVRGQICNPNHCIPIKSELEAGLQVESGQARPGKTEIRQLKGTSFGPERPEPSSVAAAPDGAGSPALPLGEGFLSFLAIAFLAGLGALVTPCVFPMIPITVSFFSKFAEVSIKRSVTMAAIYAASIVGTFTLLGVVISLLFGAVGMQALSSSAGFNIFLFLLLVIFAFNLFGLFEIQIPNWLVSRSVQKEQELSSEDGSLAKQALGVFFMAITFTLVSFTCTVGFIGVVLAEAAKGNWFYPAFGMLAFSLAFSLPFFILAVFPSWADKLKSKRGDWMIAVKVVLGFVELAGAFKFLSNVDLLWGWEFVTRPLVLSCWVAIFVVAGLYLLRMVNLPSSDETRAVGPLRMGFAMAMLSLAAFLFTGIRDTKSMGGWIDGWLPPAVYPGQEAELEGSGDSSSHLSWMKDDLSGAMKRAREENKPLFVDFTGYTCTNCRYMETAVFPRPEIRSKLETMVLLTAYTDCEEAVCEEQRDLQVKRFETAALPFYAILNPHDDSTIDTFASSTNDPAEYERWLSAALEKWESVKPAAAPKEASVAGAEESKNTEVSADGEPVEFSFPDISSGQGVKLSSLRGQWVLVNFWASWCSPCLRELESEFPEALKKAPHVKLLTVAFDGEDTKAASLKFIESVPLLGASTNLLGGEDVSEAELPAAFLPLENLPASYLVDPEGRIVWKTNASVTQEQLDEVLGQAKPAKSVKSDE